VDDPTRTDPDKYAVVFENVFMELKQPAPGAPPPGALGPSG
jgi:hypothetical protein